MQKHTKIYLNYFGYYDYVPCEICNRKAVDIHHIECRGIGGAKNKDTIENLMALCRECHVKYGDKKQYKEHLKTIHNLKIANNIK